MVSKRAEQIAADLEERILRGLFADGERLDELRLAEEFSVSRTPLREAFQQLARTGLIEHLPRRGVFVRLPGPVDLVEMFEVMAELEAACARLAATRITEAALAELAEANRCCKIAVAAADAESYYDWNERFHRIIYAQSGNRFLDQETLRLQRRLRPYRRAQLRLRGRMVQSMAEHEAIVDALSTGHADKAATVMRRHVAIQGEKFHHLIASLKPAAE